MRISISCGPFTEKNTVEIEKQQSHPRRAQQSHPRRQSAAGLPSYAPHDSKARLQHESTRRDPWRSHVHRTRFDKRRSSSSYRLPMQRGRGARPLAFSWRSKGDILSRERISPLPDSSAKRCTSPRAARGTLPVSLFRETKSPRRIGEGFLLCCVCIFRREKITSGGVPLCKY